MVFQMSKVAKGVNLVSICTRRCWRVGLNTVNVFPRISKIRTFLNFRSSPLNGLPDGQGGQRGELGVDLDLASSADQPEHRNSVPEDRLVQEHFEFSL